jgi:hypothetical protein
VLEPGDDGLLVVASISGGSELEDACQLVEQRF